MRNLQTLENDLVLRLLEIFLIVLSIAELRASMYDPREYSVTWWEPYALNLNSKSSEINRLKTILNHETRTLQAGRFLLCSGVLIMCATPRLYTVWGCILCCRRLVPWCTYRTLNSQLVFLMQLEQKQQNIFVPMCIFFYFLLLTQGAPRWLTSLTCLWCIEQIHFE